MKKKIMLLAMAMSMTLGGCGMIGKDSRSYIEGKVSNIDEVYPTENLEDLFEKFPEGFNIKQNRVFKEDEKSYSVDILMEGDIKTREIKGTVKKVLIETEPYRETTLKETKIEYKKGTGLELEDKSLTDELLPKNYFLFQKVKLNKEVLSKLNVIKKRYTQETDSYSITYAIEGKISELELFDTMILSGANTVDKRGYSRPIELRKINGEYELFIEGVYSLKEDK